MIDAHPRSERSPDTGSPGTDESASTPRPGGVNSATTQERSVAALAARTSISEARSLHSEDVTKDTETLAMVSEALRLLSGGVALIYFAYSAYNLGRVSQRGVLTVMLLDQVPIVVAVVIFTLSHFRRLRKEWVHVASTALALSVAANIALTTRTYGSPDELENMIAVAVGGAAIVMSTRWLVVVLAGTLGCALWAASGVCTPGEFVGVAVTQIAAVIVAIIIFLGRIRGQRRLLELRRRDAQTTQELKQTLARAEREYQEHQASERQRLALLDQLRQAQKLEALGTLAGGVAHDINNVIGAITAIASTAVRQLPDEADGRRELREILVAARRGTTLTRNLVRFARQEEPRNAPFIVDEVVKEVEVLLRRTFAKHIELRTHCSSSEWSVIGDAGLIGHALMNLCINSADAITERGRITIETRARVLAVVESQQMGVPAGQYVELLVSDNGYGMSRDVLDRAFEPFFTTKDQKRRSGLGLPMVYGTVQQHRGGLQIESQPGEGTQTRIVLPAVAMSASPKVQTLHQTPRVDSLRPAALFVDDEPLLRRAGKRMLSSLGYEVMLARDGQDALDKFMQHRHRIGVVVLDVAMPRMSGTECCVQLRRLEPTVPIVLASGFPKGNDLQPILALQATTYLRKPYELDDLSRVLVELGDAYRHSTRLACQVNLVRVSSPPACGLVDALTCPERENVGLSFGGVHSGEPELAPQADRTTSAGADCEPFRESVVLSPAARSSVRRPST